MIVKTLDDFEYKWKLDEVKKDRTKASGPHKKVRQFLQEKYPTVLILEEVQIQVKRNKYLYLDFYIPLYKIAVEVQGRQHREFTLHFSKSQIDFIRAKTNDLIKEQWCELNEITLIQLQDNEENEWKKQF